MNDLVIFFMGGLSWSVLFLLIWWVMYSTEEQQYLPTLPLGHLEAEKERLDAAKPHPICEDCGDRMKSGAWFVGCKDEYVCQRCWTAKVAGEMQPHILVKAERKAATDDN